MTGKVESEKGEAPMGWLIKGYEYRRRAEDRGY